MATKKKALGKGVDSLISNKISTRQLNTGIEKTVTPEQPDQMVKISQVEPNREQPRKKFDEDGLIELAESIKQYGILQPLLVQKREDYYEIIAGERRWRAAKLAGLKEVPVIIRELSEQEIVEIALIENIQREDLNPIEEALAYRRLLEEYHLKQDEIAQRVSKSRTAVTNSLRLLRLSDPVQEMVINEMLSTGHARCLISIEDPEQQYTLAQQIFDEKLSVRETEKLVKKILEQKEDSQKQTKQQDAVLEAIHQQLAEQMKQIFGTKVEIKQSGKKKGKIEIEYYSQDELNRLLELIRTIQQ